MSKPLFDFESPNIIIFDQLDSTSREAKKMVSTGHAEHGLIIWAKKQLNGYGRYGREWQSVQDNLTFSFVIENERKAELVAVYSFIAALSIKKALQKYLTKSQINQLSFKWPNDVLYNSKKIGGVIFESEIKNGKLSNIVCGIGININSSPKTLDFVTSLSAEGINIDKADELLCSIVINMDHYLSLADEKGDQVIYNQWLESAYKLHKEIIVISNKEEIKGIFMGIIDGNIIIKDKDGEERKLYTGDVFFSEKEKITMIMGNRNINNLTLLRPHQQKSSL